MSKLFIFTAGNKPARAHLKDSIESPISSHIIDTHLTASQKQQMQASDGNFYAWGAIPGKKNKIMWANLNSGDIVLCVYASAYQYVSQCIQKYRNKELAEAIWGTDDKDNTWEYMYFLTEPLKTSVPFSNLTKYLHKTYWGFTEISDERLGKIRNDFTSIDNFVNEQFSYTPSTTRVPPEKWSNDELRESMRGYLWMLDKEKNEESYNKTELYKTLSSTSLNKRTPKSVEYRMENISHVLRENELDWISGITPMSGVGANNAVKLLEFYQEFTTQTSDFKPSLPKETEKEVTIRKNAAITGKEAEDEFENWANNQGWEVINTSDSHGLGYDFECVTDEGEKIFVEVKGCRGDIDAIRLTEREWAVAKQKGGAYRLVVISNLDQDDFFVNEFNDPYNLFNDDISDPQITISVAYHLKKQFLVDALEGK